MSDTKIVIADTYDSFYITLTINGKETVYNFNQEDDRTGLVDMFKELGFENVEYEVDC